MGMTYDELGLYGVLRKMYRCGPVSMYVKLCDVWREKGMAPKVIADKVRARDVCVHMWCAGRGDRRSVRHGMTLQVTLCASSVPHPCRVLICRSVHSSRTTPPTVTR